MRVTVIAACVVALLASTAQAEPWPTGDYASLDEMRAELGDANSDFVVSLQPIPTPKAEAFDDDFMDLLGVEPGPAKTNRTFAWCANGGAGKPSCFCNGVVRFGGYGTRESRAAYPDAVKWAYRRNCGNVDCAPRHFGGAPNPYPGERRICQCTEPIPTPLPEPTTLSWEFCSEEGEPCKCGNNALMRFGSTGSADVYAGGSRPTFFADHPEVTRWKYLEIPETGRARFRCANETIPGAHPWPEETREENQRFICQCAALPPKNDELCDAQPTPAPTWTPPISQTTTPQPTPEAGASARARTGLNAHTSRTRGDDDAATTTATIPAIPAKTPKPWEVRWTWCGDENDVCNCLGVARFGHHGESEMYADNSKFFRDNRDVFKWVNKETRGAFTCDAATFGDLDPFPGHKKLCQCASGVGAEIFAPFVQTSQPDAGTDAETADESSRKEAGTPQVVLASAEKEKEEARLGATPRGGAGTASAPRHAYHHTMPSRSFRGGPLEGLVARDLAGFTPEELRLLHREDEVAAMKAATAAIAAAEGELPLLPEEKRLAGLGAAAPGGGAAFSRPAALLLAGAGAAAVAAAVVATRRRTSISPEEDEHLATRRYDVYL